MTRDKVMLIDGNSIINRAFYGLQGKQLLATSDGLYTNAIFGFINILNKLLDEEKPQYLSVAFDLKAPTFRHKEFEGYKAKRKGMPHELVMQMPVMKEVLDAMNIHRLELEGYEADDIIGSVSYCAEEQGMEVVIVTGDRDSFQLISENVHVKLPVTKAGRTETEEYDLEKLNKRYGVTPIEFIDVKGLMGDQSDNIPGVPGIGEVTALALIKEFGSIENVYNNIEKIEKKGVKEKLEANKDLAFVSKRLATIDRNIHELCSIDELKMVEVNREALYNLFRRLEFKGFIEKYGLAKATISEQKVTKKIQCIDALGDLSKLKENIKLAGELSIFCLIDKEGSFTTKLTGIALSWGKEKSIYISISDSIAEEIFLSGFTGIFEDRKIKKYGHDLKPFIVLLKSKGIAFEGLSFDTKICAYLINPSRDTYSVSDLAREYLNLSIDSIEEMSGKGKKFMSYYEMGLQEISSVAGQYAETIFEIKSVFEKMIKDNNQVELFYEVELPLVEVLSDMEHWGFRVDLEALKIFSGELQEKIEVLTNKIYDIAGGKFNINSTKQLGVILFEELGLPATKKTKTGFSTNAEVLDQLADKHEIVSKILEYRQLVKLKSTYAEGLQNVVNPYTGKIHTSFNQTVTVTGRISSAEPNLQNIPIKLEMGRVIRKVFIPSSDDFILADADYSQVELRVLAHITNDENMIEAFNKNEDIHTTTASQVFGIAMEEVSATMRNRAKAVNFGIVYGIGDFSLAKDLGISKKEAKKYIDGYLEKYSSVKQYMHDIVEYGKLHGYVSTLLNRRRYLPELQSSNFNIRSQGERLAMNTPIQGTAADIIKIAMVRVYKELKDRKLKSRLILSVHDELIIETHTDEKGEVVKILKEGMEGAIKLKVPLSVEVKCGNNWYETK